MPAALFVAGCGGDGGGDDSRPSIVVTTSILGDVVEQLVGGDAEVIIVMPAGADPHDFQASARQANEMREADALVANGAGFEHGLEDVVEAARSDGVPTFEAIRVVDTIPLGGAAGADEGAGAVDPHFFTDPDRMAAVVEELETFLAETVPALDTDALHEAGASYREELAALGAEIEDRLADVAPADRVLVTNHEVFSYFADRFGFEVVGVVVPGGGTGETGNARDLAALADVVRERGVPAIFVDASSPAELARTLAAEVGTDVDVVELYTESLGDGGSGADTYLGLMQTNAARIAEALG